MSGNLFLEDVRKLLMLSKSQTLEKLKKNGVQFKKDNSGNIWFKSKCFGSDFDYIVSRCFYPGYEGTITFSRPSEDCGNASDVFELFEQSQVLLVALLGIPHISKLDSQNGTRRDRWSYDGLGIGHVIGERFMLYEVISIKFDE